MLTKIHNDILIGICGNLWKIVIFLTLSVLLKDCSMSLHLGFDLFYQHFLMFYIQILHMFSQNALYPKILFSKIASLRYTVYLQFTHLHCTIQCFEYIYRICNHSNIILEQFCPSKRNHVSICSEFIFLLTTPYPVLSILIHKYTLSKFAHFEHFIKQNYTLWFFLNFCNRLL